MNCKIYLVSQKGDEKVLLTPRSDIAKAPAIKLNARLLLIKQAKNFFSIINQNKLNFDHFDVDWKNNVLLLRHKIKHSSYFC